MAQRDDSNISVIGRPAAGLGNARSLAQAARARLGPPPELGDWPLVSLVVPNRDGASMLRRLLAGLVEYTEYPSLELVLVDNASSDESLEFIRRVEAPFPISIVSNPHNESFSDTCNQGAELASGELLLFLNNDVEPFEPGWLHELVACLQARRAGAAAATLVCLEEEHRRRFSHGYGVQHRGLEFEEEDGMLVPALCGWEADPLDDRLGLDDEPPAAAAACLLVDRDSFERVGGFSHGYVYGAEDIDLCLKLRDAGFPVLLSGRSLAIHHPVSTRRANPFEEEHARKLANRLVLWGRWGPRLRRDYELGRLGDGGEWPLGVCLKVANPVSASDLDGVRVEAERRGWRCLVLEAERVGDSLGLNFEVAVHVHGPLRYVPSPAQRNVLWAPPGTAPPEGIERARYELLVEGEPANVIPAIGSMAIRRYRSKPGLSAISARSSLRWPVRW